MVITEQDGSYNGWPLIIKTKNGDLLTFYSKGSQHLTVDNSRKVVYKRSTNKGKTWGPEVVVLDDEYSDAIFSVGITEKGTIIIVVGRANIGGTTVDHGVMRSVNEGYNWSTYQPLNLPPTAIMVNVITEIPGKGLLAGWNDRPYTCETLWSYDEGLTWGIGTPIMRTATPTDAPLEPRFIDLGNGKIFGIGRTNEYNRGLFQIQKNGDEPWKVMDTNTLDQYMTPSSLTYKDGYIEIIYFHRTEGKLRRRRVRAIDIWDNPLGWPESDVIAYGSKSISDGGYPHTVEVDDEFLTVYYSGDCNSTGIYGVFHSAETNIESIIPVATCSFSANPITFSWTDFAWDNFSWGSATSEPNETLSKIVFPQNDYWQEGELHFRILAVASGDTDLGLTYCGTNGETFVSTNNPVTSNYDLFDSGWLKIPADSGIVPKDRDYYHYRNTFKLTAKGTGSISEASLYIGLKR